MFFSGSNSSAQLAPSKPKSKGFSARADEIPKAEKGFGFLRLNSLEDDMESMTSSTTSNITETPKKSQMFRHHHRPSHNQWQQQQQFQAFPSPLAAHTISHIPYNLTKGHYEYWTSVPQVPMIEQTLMHNSLELAAATAYALQEEEMLRRAMLPNNFSKTVTSFVGGVCDWVADTLDLTLDRVCGVTTAVSSDGSHQVAVQKKTQLNPNAKAFVPLNPNAKEFHPKSVGASAAGIVKEEQLKPVAERKATPWIAQAPALAVMEPLIEKEERLDLSESAAESSFDFDSSIAPYVASSSEDEDDSSEEETEEENDRVRTYSVGSDDSFAIDFADESCPATAASCDKVVREACGSSNQIFNQHQNGPKRNLLDAFLIAPGDSDDESDDDEEDIDQVDDANREEILAEFECNDFVIEKEFPKALPEGQADLRIAVANKTWNDCYDSTDVPVIKIRKVSIASDNKNTVIFEDPELSEDLAQARKSDLMQRKADKERMERLLSKIFEKEHREKMWKIVHANRNRMLI